MAPPDSTGIIANPDSPEMASASTLQASSSTSIPHSYSYDVFLSFRGEDTRKNFTDHLYNTLVAYGIRTFRDDEELQKGDDIKSGLSTAIQNSKIFLIIFSENYATSKWCLNELVKITECTAAEDEDKRVIAVFYHVQPRDVGHQSGSFQDAFLNHEKDADQEKKEMIKKWRIALAKVAKLSGYHVDNQYEAEVIQQIREVIITRLKRKPLHVGDNIVGMDFHLKQLQTSMKIERDDVYMIGIYGISGIGKTTLAMTVYNDISSQFDGSSFLRIGETSINGLVELQKKLLEDILKGQSPAIQDRSQGINVIKERLCSKRVLIILDDVDDIEKLDNFVGKYGWYGPKSIVVITTKDINLLSQGRVDELYEVRALDHDEASELFNWWAFKQNTPKSEDFKYLSDCVVEYAKGHPLALKVLGGFLCDKNEDEWKSELDKLKRIPNMKVQDILRVSYDKLDDVNQDIFLDIACFFRGEDKDFVSRILGSDAKIGIRVLQQRYLITTFENKLDMHDLLQQMGREVVRKECPKEAGGRSRLWDPSDVQHVLTKNAGTKTIEGLFIEIPVSCQIQLFRDSFTKMDRLRLLKVFTQSWNYYKVDYPAVPVDFELSSSELKLLHFEKYPLKSLPTNFDGNNLVELNLRGSRIKQLWKENEVLKNLKVIDLTNSNHLVEMPDFASVPNLEILILRGCKSLESLPLNFHKLEHLRILSCFLCSQLKSFPQIHGNMSKLRKIDFRSTAIVEVPSSIKHLSGLEYLNLRFCKNLVSLPESICRLRSLQTLIVAGCSELKGFPNLKDDMENLETLDLSGTAIEELPSSIGRLKSLQRLDLSKCRNLVNLPESIWDLRCLEKLPMASCSNLKGIPDLKDDMENLKMIDLSGTAINELPSSIGHLKALQRLDLMGITKIKELPSSIGDLNSLECLDLRETGIKKLPSSIGHLKNLQSLDLSCTTIKELPSSIGHLKALQSLHLSGMVMIKELPSSIGHLTALQKLDLSDCKSLVKLPESICDLRSLHTIDVKGCSKLESLKVKLKDEYGSAVTCSVILKPGVIWSNHCFSSLQTLNLQPNNQIDQAEAEAPSNPNHHILPLSSLVELSLQNSIYKGSEFFEDGFHLSSLKILSVGNFNPMARGILGDIRHQSSLKRLSLHIRNCNLMEEGIPTNNIQKLSPLVNLSLEYCNLWEGDVLDHICCFPSLKKLSLTGNHFSSIPTSIDRLSNLRGLNLSRCKRLQHIPPHLPSSLLFLDAHCSDGISSSPSLLAVHSLFGRFESKLVQTTDVQVGDSRFSGGEGKSIVIPRSSTLIQEMMMIRNGGSSDEGIIIKLPENWYENDNDLLGFALCCVYVPMLRRQFENESALEFELDGALGHLQCVLSVSTNNDDAEDIEKFSFSCWCDLRDDDDDGLSDQMWVIYYPKDAIEEKTLSREWTRIMASFRWGTLEVKECGFHLIYSEQHQHSQDDDRDNVRMPMLSNLLEDAKRKRDDAQHNQADQEPREANTDLNL